jgi:signal transduction histidine kinase
MRRLRYLFAIVAVTLMATLGLLVEKSLHSLAFEQQVRQQVVAERMFDEMERTLSRLLESEEQRPVEDYQGSPATGTEPFVLSRFEIDAREEIPARRETAEPVRDDGAQLDADLFRQLREPAAPAAGGTAEKRQAPGTTVRLRDARKGAPPATDPAPEGKEAGAVSEYDALRALNKAVEDRVGRRHADSAPTTTGADDLAAVRPEAGASGGAFADLGGELGRARMSGRAVSPDRVVLFRTVAHEGSLYHQGAVLDVPALGRWLVTEAIGGDGLAQFANLDFFTEAIGSAPAAVDASTYLHRFAAPFADLSARLRLRPLATRGSEFYVYALSALLLALTVLSLGFLYRMVAVTVRFAERRANFVAAVSHELKTPLTAIRMYGEMLRDGVVSSEAKRAEYYRHITDESERLSRLINNVLEHAKLEKGNGGGLTAETSVAPVMEDVAQMMRAHAAEHGFDLRVEVAADLPFLRCEVDALKQVLWNLVDNAIKYAAKATDRRITLRADRDDDRVRISVRDGGPGVDARHLAQIFEPFYRGETERTRSTKGAGLGLALVRGLVERMGATVRGRNADGGGFVVEIWFPAAD